MVVNDVVAGVEVKVEAGVAEVEKGVTPKLNVPKGFAGAVAAAVGVVVAVDEGAGNVKLANGDEDAVEAAGVPKDTILANGEGFGALSSPPPPFSLLDLGALILSPRTFIRQERGYQ